MQINSLFLTFSLYIFSRDRFTAVSDDLKHIADVKEMMNSPHFKEYLSLGLIDEIALRNAIIKDEYIRLKQKNSAYQSIVILSEKFNLSDSAINTILFRKREKKKVFLGNLTSL